jgi:hypothetical protein
VDGFDSRPPPLKCSDATKGTFGSLLDSLQIQRGNLIRKRDTGTMCERSYRHRYARRPKLETGERIGEERKLRVEELYAAHA